MGSLRRTPGRPATSDRLSREVRALFALSSIAELARGYDLVCSTIGQMIGPGQPSTDSSRAGFAIQWETYLAALDQAVSRAASSVAASCRTRTANGLLTRASHAMRDMLEAYDDGGPSRQAGYAQVLMVTSQIDVSAWALPAQRLGRPCRHRLGENQLVIVLDGRPTLHSADAPRELREGQVVPCARGVGVGRVLVNTTPQTVRFLTLGSAAKSELGFERQTSRASRAGRRESET
jgi:hypothetical protein